jgi:hypothetical protein
MENAPEYVKEFFNEMLPYSEMLQITKSSLTLRSAYIKEKVLSEKSKDDALHVAIASTNQCDMIVSWNFKHIVNFNRIPLFNAVNALNGVGSIQIYSPMEVIAYEK